jgi:hypothetical protein
MEMHRRSGKRLPWILVAKLGRYIRTNNGDKQDRDT